MSRLIIVALFLASLALAWSVFCNGGIEASDWGVTLLILGCVSVCYWLFSRRIRRAPPLAAWLRWLILLLPVYLIAQLVPLPGSVLQILSPSRASLLRNLEGAISNVNIAPLSVNPPASVLRLMMILGCIATFLLIREITWRFPGKRWGTAIPLIVIGALEAALGMFQVFAGWPSANSTGTYGNRDHFAGLLEIVLPFATLGGLAILRSSRNRLVSTASSAMKACAVWAIAAMIFLAIMYSLSRMGFLVALAVLFIAGALTIRPKLQSPTWRWSSLGVITAAVILMFVFFPPTQLIQRFAEISSTDKISADTRLSLWKETLPLISEYRLFGCGFGGFESVFLKYQAVAANFSVQFAHNDYLQYLAELGFFGFSILAAILAGVFRPIFRATLRTADENRRLLDIACFSAFTAVLLHSLVDFNMYIPANAMTLSWIAGIGSANQQS
ncbi:MAG: O-antigen ligase family protein [Acidobacteriaceae bacterium]|nr:O-antigen ligase family protein [Acidobacteriaceae bacterium]MBV9779062.1 O-antigen ligase family protein [Acidobacteriaceae bacterium]